MTISLSPKLISIMIPSRSRFDKLLSTIQTFRAQLSPEQRALVEFIIRVDSDDLGTLRRLPDLPYSDFAIHVIISDRLGGYKDAWIYANQCARLSVGRYLLGWNDDAVFETPDWFTILQAQITQDRNAYSYWFGGTPTQVYAPNQPPRIEDWPCFIAHHRLFYDILGFFGAVGGVDSFLYYMLGPLGLIKKIETIKVHHLAWFQIPPEKRDETSHNNSRDGQMLPNDTQLIRQCQEKIIRFAQNQQHAKTL